MEILIFFIAYIIGSFPSAYLVVKLFTGKNVMNHGTGNIGTMNTHRTTNNKFLTLLVLMLDIGKGLLSCFVALYSLVIISEGLLFNFMDPLSYLITFAGLGVILGHNYSLFMKFKGGKGLATGAGFFLMIAPSSILVWIAIFFVIVLIFRYMVLGQMVASVLLPVYSYFFLEIKLLPVFFLIGLFISIKHAPRMKDVLTGKEPKMYYKVR